MSHTIEEADALGAARAAVGADPEGIAAALARFAAAFDDPETACNTAADMLDCAQADALAGLLQAAGQPGLAAMWADYHAAWDTEEDAHWNGPRHPWPPAAEKEGTR